MAKIQIFNPVHQQRIKKNKLNVMGRVHGKSATLAIYLNNFLLRRVKPNINGAFELRIDLSECPEGEQQIEIRQFLGQNTERQFVKFSIVREDSDKQEDAGSSSEEE